MRQPDRCFVEAHTHSNPLTRNGQIAIVGLRRGMLLVVIITFCGCVSTPYYAGSHANHYESPELAELTNPQIERGQPRPILDAVGWVIGIPDKIILWNIKVANHKISPETESAIAEYLAVNELDTVKVRLNQYAPLEDWRRLRANKSVGAGWRYTLGTLAFLGETIFAGRVFGGDHYNPFSNTIHVYSDVPAIGLHESGHAKDFARRYYKGTYAAAYLIPGVPLYHEAVATNDALSYLEAQGDVEAEAAGYRILYPAYGTYAGDAAGYLAPGYGGLLYVGGVLTGHLFGNVQAHRVRDRIPSQPYQRSQEFIPDRPYWELEQPEYAPSGGVPLPPPDSSPELFPAPNSTSGVFPTLAPAAAIVP